MVHISTGASLVTSLVRISKGIAEREGSQDRDRSMKPRDHSTKPKKHRWQDSGSFGNGKQLSLLHHADLMLHSTGAVVSVPVVEQRWKRQGIRNNTPDAKKKCRKGRKPE
jgi:hypothetical protein